jgi:hypothetical protein
VYCVCFDGHKIKLYSRDIKLIISMEPEDQLSCSEYLAIEYYQVLVESSSHHIMMYWSNL